MPQVNIALDALGIIITLIVFFSCLVERIKKESRSNSFLLLMVVLIFALVFDIVAWSCEGNASLSLLTVVGNMFATFSGYVVIFIFIMYLRGNLYRGGVAARVVVILFGVFCFFAIVLTAVDVVFLHSYVVNADGHYVHGDNIFFTLLHLVFPITSFFTILIMVLAARGTRIKNRIIFLIYAAIPTLCVILDYCIHGLSLTYIGFVISTLIIYTVIYQQRLKLIREQRTAIMMSQINPHFMYNTLTTVAAMCEIDPKKAKNLTIDFSTFLRRNLDTLTSTELVPFEQELRHIGCYLKIEQARFKDKINVVYAIDCKDFYVPALTVQPLVENAIKHGITKKSGGGTVRISTYKDAGAFVIEIKDNGVGFDSEKVLGGYSDRVGISNVKNRLRDMCGGKLLVKSKKDVGTRATIRIPDKRKYRIIKVEK